MLLCGKLSAVKEKLSPHAETSLWHIILLVVCDMVKHTLQSVKLGDCQALVWH